jgi:hypothetical protein
MGIESDDVCLSGLKRFPEGFSAKNSSVSRFICGYIAGGADIVFGEGNAIQKAMKLSLCKSSATPVDVLKTRAETTEKQRARKEFKRGNDEFSLGQKQREAYARRNWSACK